MRWAKKPALPLEGCSTANTDTHFDIERFHEDTPDVINYRDSEQMFPGLYHRRMIPCTRKVSARATLSLNSFHARLCSSHSPGCLVVSLGDGHHWLDLAM
jgi:hypothetical protein